MYSGPMLLCEYCSHFWGSKENHYGLKKLLVQDGNRISLRINVPTKTPYGMEWDSLIEEKKQRRKLALAHRQSNHKQPTPTKCYIPGINVSVFHDCNQKLLWLDIFFPLIFILTWTKRTVSFKMIPSSCQLKSHMTSYSLPEKQYKCVCY